MPEVGALFLLGLTTGLHCVGMCGPIVVTLQAPLMAQRRWAGNLAYNMGRITTYATVATLLFVVTDASVEHLPLDHGRRGLSMLVGGLLVCLGIRQLLPVRLPGGLLPAAVSGVSKIGRAALEKGRLPSIFLCGMIFGLIPCGMSYGMFLRAMDGSSLPAASAMGLAFGLGTLPWLMAAGIFSHYLVGGLRKWGEVLSGLVMIGLGIERIYRAMTMACCLHHQ